NWSMPTVPVSACRRSFCGCIRPRRRRRAMVNRFCRPASRMLPWWALSPPATMRSSWCSTMATTAACTAGTTSTGSGRIRTDCGRSIWTGCAGPVPAGTRMFPWSASCRSKPGSGPAGGAGPAGSDQIAVERLLDLALDHAGHRRQHHAELDCHAHAVLADQDAAIHTAALERQFVILPAALGPQLGGQLVRHLLRAHLGLVLAQCMLPGNFHCCHDFPF